MNEAIINKPKRKNIKIIILIVVVMVISAFGVSYSAFFSIGSQSKVQQIRAGVLDVVVNNNTILTNDLFPANAVELPTSVDSVEYTSQPHSDITIYNNGDIDAEYSISLVPDTLEAGQTAANFQYLIISIIDTSTNEWHNFGTAANPVYNTPLTSLENNGVYPILRDVITPTTFKQYKIYFNLAETTPASEIGNYVYLKYVVKSMTVNGRIGS